MSLNSDGTGLERMRGWRSARRRAWRQAMMAAIEAGHRVRRSASIFKKSMSVMPGGTRHRRTGRLTSANPATH